MFQRFLATRRTTALMVVFALAIILTACNAQAQSTGSYASVPAGMAYAEGKEIYFTHTEASDPAIAEKLTNMMKSPVLHVPSLAQVPAEALADVYVFENGLTGKGPLGFQPDVFNSPPGSDGYSPLRKITLVKWADAGKPRELKSQAEIEQAEAGGELTTQRTDIVVNMPFLVWDGGKR